MLGEGGPGSAAVLQQLQVERSQPRDLGFSCRVSFSLFLPLAVICSRAPRAGRSPESLRPASPGNPGGKPAGAQLALLSWGPCCAPSSTSCLPRSPQCSKRRGLWACMLPCPVVAMASSGQGQPGRRGVCVYFRFLPSFFICVPLTLSPLRVHLELVVKTEPSHADPEAEEGLVGRGWPLSESVSPLAVLKCPRQPLVPCDLGQAETWRRWDGDSQGL